MEEECFAAGVDASGAVVDGSNERLFWQGSGAVVVGGGRVAEVVDEEIGVLSHGDVIVLDVV